MANARQYLIGLVVSVFLAGGLIIVIWNESQAEPAADVDNPPTTSQTETYNLATIQVHGDATSCWTAIEGNVYDLTDYIANHPGGSKAILAVCGSDGTGSFNSMPGSVMVAARLALSKFKIGTLSD
ncbi:MAG: cytochrome b5-like heme/steroid binding domain-containing protein [Patescibacteria group bacterium]